MLLWIKYSAGTWFGDYSTLSEITQGKVYKFLENRNKSESLAHLELILEIEKTFSEDAGKPNRNTDEPKKPTP